MQSVDTLRERLTAAIGERYEVFDPIGAGGMATVFLSRHRVHGGFCAVKVLAEHLAQQEPLVKSFLTEAQASASLDAHPNIVNIVDIDQSGGLYYMIMKYVEGEDLSSYLKRKGKLDWKQAAYIAQQAADALAYAHDRGVIHRDLKPSNVRIGMRGGVTVLDFGIAKMGQTPSSFTEMGARAGTPHYMAPEQIRGHSVDHRSDLYSLGVLLYEMVVGQRPFEGENRESIWYAHATMEPPTPREVDPNIPEALSHIILNLLAKEADNRYESAARVSRHLRTLGLEDIAETLEPVDQLPVEELRHRTLTPTSLPGERTPVDRPMLTTAETEPQPAPAGANRDLWKLMAFAAVAVAILLAGIGWAILGSRPDPAPAPEPPVVAQPQETPAPAPATPEPAAEPVAAQPEAGSPPPQPPPSAGRSEAEREAAAEEAARQRRAAEARRQAEIEAAKARLRGEAPPAQRNRP